jgi:hypothetical protein
MRDGIVQNDAVLAEFHQTERARDRGLGTWFFVFFYSLIPLLLGFVWGSESGPSWNLLGGLVGIVLFLAVFFAAFLWLYVFKAPTRVSSVSIRWYWYLTLIFIVAQVNMAVAGVWDEAWHVAWGQPFGPDFFWRPHLLLYAAFGSFLAAGFVVWLYVFWRFKGNMRQKLQADPLFGLFLIMSSFIFLTLPADPFWHQIYGQDLSVFSVPHVILFYGGVGLAFLIFLSLELALQGFGRALEQVGSGLRVVGFVLRFLILFIFSYMSFFQLLDFTPFEVGDKPVWLLPLIAVLLVGTLMNVSRQVLGRSIWALVSGLLAFGLRFTLYSYFGAERAGALDIVYWRALALLIPLGIGAILDFVFFARLAPRLGQEKRHFAYATFMAVVLLLSLPFYASVFALNFWQIGAFALVLIVPMVVGLELFFSTIFGFLRGLLQLSESSALLSNHDLLWLSAIAVFNFVFLLVFILTASAPV